MDLMRNIQKSFKQLYSRENTEYSLSSILENGEDFFIHEDIIGPGNWTSHPHYHNHTDECLYVLEGSVFAHFGKEIHHLRKGDFAKFPKGSEEFHGIENRSSEPAKILVIKRNIRDDVVFSSLKPNVLPKAKH